MSGEIPAKIPLTPINELSILGVPLGPPNLASPFFNKKLIDGLVPLLNKLIEFEDSQAASFLLRVSASYSLHAEDSSFPLANRLLVAPFQLMPTLKPA